MFGLIMALAGMLNQLNLNTLTTYKTISTYRQLSGRFYMELPVELKSPTKGLISIKNNNQVCLLWCHVRYINPSKEHPKRI